MRKNLFRGKRVDNGEWIEGFYCKYGHTGKVKSYIIPVYASALYSFEVIPETVSEFTGLTDMNGIKIFEADIVSTKYKLGRGGYYVFEVYYNENLCQFALTINSGSYTKNKQYDWLKLTSLKAGKIEVIGNIYDNPKLLRGGNNV